MKNIKITRNPYLFFLPFLLFYIVVVLIMQKNALWGDEIRHFSQAQNLLQGFYSPPSPNVTLGNGPGYPLVLLPFLALHIPFICIKLLNAVFLYLSVVFLFKALERIVSFRVALIFSLFWACYYNALDFIGYMYAETISVFLVSSLVLCLIIAFDPANHAKAKRYTYLSGFIIGYLALTKIIFGYVMLCMLIGCGLLWIISRKNKSYQKGLIIIIISFITVAPYLVYTNQLTGRVFYWGTSGGNNLYWMSTPYKDEYGNWFSDPVGTTDFRTADSSVVEQVNVNDKGGLINGGEDSLRIHHGENFIEINKHTGVEKDDVTRRIVFENIKAHPFKYVQNCISNIGRILFNYPYAYSPQKPGTLARLPLNGAIVLFALFCLIPTFINWRKLNYSIRFILFVALLYLGGSVLGSAEIRMFTIAVPILLCWIAFILQKTVKIKLFFKEQKIEDSK